MTGSRAPRSMIAAAEITPTTATTTINHCVVICGRRTAVSPHSAGKFVLYTRRAALPSTQVLIDRTRIRRYRGGVQTLHNRQQSDQPPFTRSVAFTNGSGRSTVAHHSEVTSPNGGAELFVVP